MTNAALDADIPNGHDDPLNFDPESFAEVMGEAALQTIVASGIRAFLRSGHFGLFIITVDPALIRKRIQPIISLKRGRISLIISSGGRTRTRTLDPLIKSLLTPID
jgi:hypothetical protein